MLVQQEADENNVEMREKKRFKICQVTGNQDQQRENEIFPTALIKVPRDFAHKPTDKRDEYITNSYDRLNYLGFSKAASSSGKGASHTFMNRMLPM